MLSSPIAVLHRRDSQAPPAHCEAEFVVYVAPFDGFPQVTAGHSKAAGSDALTLRARH